LERGAEQQQEQPTINPLAVANIQQHQRLLHLQISTRFSHRPSMNASTLSSSSSACPAKFKEARLSLMSCLGGTFIHSSLRKIKID